MSHQWDEIKAVVEKTEKERIINKLSLPTENDALKSEVQAFEKRFIYVNFLCEICYGVGVSIFSLMFIYLVFVWFLHLNLTI